VLGIEEGRVMGNGLLECAAWEISTIFGPNFEISKIFGLNFEISKNRKFENQSFCIN
jgi:hypothetical protein